MLPGVPEALLQRVFRSVPQLGPARGLVAAYFVTPGCPALGSPAWRRAGGLGVGYGATPHLFELTLAYSPCAMCRRFKAYIERARLLGTGPPPSWGVFLHCV